MRAGAAEVEARDRRPVPRPSQDGAHREELVEGRLAVEDLAAPDAELLFEIDGRKNAAREDEFAEPGRVRLESLFDDLSQLLAPSLPRAGAKPIRGVLD